MVARLLIKEIEQTFVGRENRREEMRKSDNTYTRSEFETVRGEMDETGNVFSFDIFNKTH